MVDKYTQDISGPSIGGRLLASVRGAAVDPWAVASPGIDQGASDYPSAAGDEVPRDNAHMDTSWEELKAAAVGMVSEMLSLLVDSAGVLATAAASSQAVVSQLKPREFAESQANERRRGEEMQRRQEAEREVNHLERSAALLRLALYSFYS